jgi:mono/diheme cytochrome c family protein
MWKTASLLAAFCFVASPAFAASSPETIAKGEYLARAGDCVVCHTGPGEKPFAGGLKMATPMGNIYTTNITPDKNTGIGAYSLEDFKAAMQKGVAKDGHHLYPAMPYPSYGKVSDDDLKALYAFFMESVPAVSRKNQDSEIPRPLNWRWPLAFWDAVFTEKEGFTPDPARDATWNRGAYLVQGLGHCGSCHTPRGIFFQEKALDQNSAKYLSGGNLDNWFASSLRSEPKAGLSGWSSAEIAEFLKTGHNAHATAFGTMIDAINNSTQYLTDDDLNAIAVYLKSLPSSGSDVIQADTGGHADGKRLFAQQCATCHLLDGKGHAPYIAPLTGNPTIADADPSSLINITLNGSSRIVVAGMPDAYRMPQFRVLLRDDEIAQIVSYIRQSWGNLATPVTPDAVAKIRHSSEAASDAVVILKMR